MAVVSPHSRIQSKNSWCPRQTRLEAMHSNLRKQKSMRDSVRVVIFSPHEERPSILLQQTRDILPHWLCILPRPLPTFLYCFKLVQSHAEPLGSCLTEVLGASFIRNGSGNPRHDDRSKGSMSFGTSASTLGSIGDSRWSGGGDGAARCGQRSTGNLASTCH